MSNTFAGYPLYDPHEVRLDRARFRRHQIPELEYANSLYVPGGRWLSRGWILMRKGDYANINTYATNLSLSIQDMQSGTALTAGGLAIVQARCVTFGLSGDANSVYLIELTDARGVLENQWECFPVNPQNYGDAITAYNVVAPAYPGQYYTQTMNGVTPWTWTTMIQNLWQQMTLLGTYPGLPVTPTGTPENWWFPGASAWSSLMKILDHIGMTVAVNPQSASPYTIVQSSGTDTYNANLQTQYVGKLEDDQSYIDTGSARVPGYVVVLFHRRNEFYGNEETVRLDSYQWAVKTYYPIKVAGPAAFSASAGIHYLFDDFTVRYDENSTPLAEDVTTATAIATERVTQYYAHIYSATVGFLDQTYSGLIPFRPGSQLDGVRWYQDYSQGRGAWRTEIVRGTNPPWPMVVK